MLVLDMISKSFTLLVTLLLCLPIFLSGGEVFVVEELKDVKGFQEVISVSLVKEEQSKSFYSFSLEGKKYWIVLEQTSTKSGTVTYFAVYDSSLEIVHFAIPKYENSQNGSLTSSMFLRQFRKEAPAEKPIRLGYGVDAITGATNSTNALIDAVNSSANIIDSIQRNR
jgi:hypothetical protein